MKKLKNEGPNFDLSDTPSPSGRRGPPPVPPKPQRVTPGNRPPKAGPQRPLPGMRKEATPFNPGGGDQPPRSARASRQTQQLTAMGPQKPAASWDVTIGNDTYRVPHHDSEEAKQAVIDMWQKDNPGMHVDPMHVKATPSPETEGASAGSLAGFQAPNDRVREAIRQMVRAKIAEVVRKKSGGGGFKLYAPNSGKKKDAKPVGEFPTKLQAKEAELQRFPPKDPEQLKRARKRLEKLKKDPKKRIEKEKEQLSGHKGKKSKRSSKKESLMRMMVQELRERLFREDEIPGSPWDEKIDSLHPDALSSDKKLHGLHRGMEAASIGALGDGHKALVKALKGIAKVNHGEHAFDPERKKMYLPATLDVDGTEIGPVHLYVDGGHVKIEISQDARQAIASLEPNIAKDLRGGLMSVEEDHLPKIDRAKKAWDERDGYLDKIHGKLEKQIGGMSGVEAHLAKALLAKHGKGKK